MTEQEEKLADKTADALAAIREHLKTTDHNKAMWLRFASRLEQALLIIGQEQPRIPRVQVGEDIFKPRKLAKAKPQVEQSTVLAHSEDDKELIRKPRKRKTDDDI